MSLEGFTPAVRAWFESTFETPTAAQAQGWPAIAGGEHSLILAPTGSGKTLAAFLWALDRLMTDPPPPTNQRCRVLYVSPLRALAVDIEKNLRTPLIGIGLAAERLGEHVHEPRVAMRTGDTTANDRRRIRTRPPDVLITTPESLYLMLTSQARELLRSVRWVILDEIHAMAGSKRGAHLALSLERLEEIADEPPQRIGLSATQRRSRRSRGSSRADGERAPPGHDRRCRAPQADGGRGRRAGRGHGGSLGRRRDAAADASDGRPGDPGDGAPQGSIWPAIHPQVLELIRAHRSTIVFVNARRLAERLAARLNELAGEELARAHHGSIAREQRLQIEDQLKRGTLKAIVATSSLELGIDMGAVDLVIQVESPGSVARGLQRIGRAGHQVGEPSRGKVFPKFRGDLLEATVVVQRMLQGAIEETRYPRNPLDVVAQQIVAMCAMDEWTVADLGRVLRRAANFEELSDELLRNVLDLLAGRYPSDEFAELRPRIVWDRRTDTLRGREGAGRLAIASGGTIPDRGLFGVFTVDGRRVGELDEEMVYESRRGEVFMLGASSWRIEDITLDRVVVSPAPGEPGKMPFWHGDKPGRPARARTRDRRRHPRALVVGARRGRLSSADRVRTGRARRREPYGVPRTTSARRPARFPDDRTIVVERFPTRSATGVCACFRRSASGCTRRGRWRSRAGWPNATDSTSRCCGATTASRSACPSPKSGSRSRTSCSIPTRSRSGWSPGSPGPRCSRRCSGRRPPARSCSPAGRRGDGRPLWQQRQRGADLLEVASHHPTFPILLEATREVLRDVFDVPGLREVLGEVRARRIHVVPVDTPRSSPFAQSLLFRWVSVYMYEADAPMAERRAAALSLDRELLRELLGAEDLRELIDPVALAELELELQHLAAGRRARNADDVHDLLRRLGHLSTEEVSARSNADPSAWLDGLERDGRAIRMRVAGQDRFVAVEDAGRYRDALGASLPLGVPGVFTEATPAPLEGLVARFARTHGPFGIAEVAERFGIGEDRVAGAVASLEAQGRLVRGEFRPGGLEREWCDADVLRSIRPPFARRAPQGGRTG
jgi:ATP-dependent Lhr-like helicase